MSFNDPGNGSRCCGRTQSMISLARELVKSGRSVAIVGVSQKTADLFAEDVRSKLATPLCKKVRGLSVDSAHLDLITASIRGEPETVVLVDHYAWEQLVDRLQSKILDLSVRLKQIKKLAQI